MTSRKEWLFEHRNDIYVKRAKQAGYPSRAAFKLQELQAKDHLFKSGMSVVELGAAPGGWTAIATSLIGPKGVLIAVDQLSMASMAGVIFIQGDFYDEAIANQLAVAVKQHVPAGKVDVVMSDMAPNLSGMASIDIPRALALMELAFDCAKHVLKSNGSFLVKAFQGEGVDAYISALRQYFKHVKLRKPPASRARSRELYVLASEFLGYDYNE